MATTEGTRPSEDATASVATPLVADATLLEVQHERDVLGTIKRSGDGSPRTALWGGRFRVLLIHAVAQYMVWLPVIQPNLDMTWVWGFYAVALAVGAASVSRFRPRIPAVLMAALWLALSLTHWSWSAWASTGPEIKVVGMESRILLMCGMTSTAVSLLGGSSRSPGTTVRRVWFGLTLTLVPMGVWEVLTRQHFIPVGAPAYAPPAFSPSGPFGNPNNFACVMVVCLGVVVGRMTERISRLHKVLLGCLAGATVLLVVATLSRGGLLGVLAVLVSGLLVPWSRAHSTSVAGQRVIRGGLVCGGVALVSLLPPLNALNPVVQAIVPGDPATLRSDAFRLTLARIALDYWRSSPWLGVGGGRFETLIHTEHHDLGRAMPVHNSFMEILAEYGLAVFIPFTAVVLCCAWFLFRSHEPSEHVQGAPTRLDRTGATYLGLVLLLGFVLTSTITSSGLRWPPYWLMLASLVVVSGQMTGGHERPVGITSRRNRLAVVHGAMSRVDLRIGG